jgi:tetratricopeptide (TPR) repeat protein
MPQKPSFIVDPSGNVRDVRGQNNAQESQRPEPGPSTPGKEGLKGSTQRTPGGIIFIPIGLIITLIIAGLRLLGGPAQKNSFPESDVNTLNRGLHYYDQGDYEMALIHFNMVIVSQPEMGEAYNDRGLTYYAMGETEKALADFNKAIELLPNPAVSYSNRGGLYLFLGNHEQALADLNKAIELSPDLAKAYHNRGLTYLDLGSYDQAIADFDQAIELTPELMFSAQATMESQMPTEESLLGSGFFTGLMDGQTYADLPTVYAARAMAYLQKGDYERAAADLEKANQLGLDPELAQQLEALLPVFMLEPQSISTLTPQSGHWEGSSNHGGYQGAVSFDIGTDGQAHDFTLSLVFGPGNSCQVASYDVLLQPDGTFSFTFGTPSSEGGNLIQGKFESSTVVAGSFSRHIECISTTGEHINGELSQGASWSAQWISGP